MSRDTEADTHLRNVAHVPKGLLTAPVIFAKELGQHDLPMQLFAVDFREDIPQKPKAPARPLDEWTLMVNLSGCRAGNADPDRPDDRSGDPRLKLEKLKQLAGLTKNKAVTLLVQCVVDPKDKKRPNAGPVLERYLIQDGRVELLSETPSHSIAKDMEDFIAIGKQYPSKRFGIISEHHGFGNAGIQGDNGKSSLDDAEAAMERGLAKAERKRADLLVWDACLMAQDGVVDRCKKIATNMIASSEVEQISVDSGADGQNLNAEVQLVLDNPFVEGRQWGKSIIDLAAKGVNDGKIHYRDRTESVTGVASLAHFDLEKADDFRVALDALGDTLVASLKVKSNREAIEKIISDTPHFGRIVPWIPVEEGIKGDLKTFVEKVQSACANGSITDRDGKLAEACKKLLVAHKMLVPETYGFKDYSSQGGLSVFLPPTLLTGPAEAAKRASRLGDIIEAINQAEIAGQRLSKLASERADEATKYRAIEETLKKMQLLIDKVSNLLKDKKYQEDWEKLRILETPLKKARTAQTTREFTSALDEMRAKATELLELPSAKAQVARVQAALERKRDKAYKEELLDDNGWNRFIKALRH